MEKTAENDGWTVVESSGPAFVSWPDGDEYARAEGVLSEIKEGQRGNFMVLDPGGAHENLSVGHGPEENRVVQSVESGEPVSVGLLVALEDKVKREHIGCKVRVEFLGWAKSKNGGTRYRTFRYSYREPQS